MLHFWVRRVLRVWVRIVTFADDCYILKIITFVGVTGSIKVHCKLSLKSSHVFVIVYVRQISNKKKHTILKTMMAGLWLYSPIMYPKQ